MIRKYAEIFCWKNVSSFCSAKATHIFSAKNIRILYIESAKTLNEITLNELVKLTTLWTTGPWLFCIGMVVWCFCFLFIVAFAHVYTCRFITCLCLFVYYALTPPACGLSLFSIKLCSVLFSNFLNQGENDCKNDFRINLHKIMRPRWDLYLQSLNQDLKSDTPATVGWVKQTDNKITTIVKLTRHAELCNSV